MQAESLPFFKGEGSARIIMVAITNAVPIRSGVVKLTFIHTAVNTIEATGSTQE